MGSGRLRARDFGGGVRGGGNETGVRGRREAHVIEFNVRALARHIICLSPSHPRPLRSPTPALTSSSPFPNQAQLLSPPCNDSDGSPVYVGSALFPTSVHPCKIVPRFRDTACRVPYGGQEVEHRGRYDLLPITADMEWVKTSGGKVPYGRRAVEGGYEEDGKKLYHAMILIEGVRVPGKAGEHLVCMSLG